MYKETEYVVPHKADWHSTCLRSARRPLAQHSFRYLDEGLLRESCHGHVVLVILETSFHISKTACILKYGTGSKIYSRSIEPFTLIIHLPFDHQTWIICKEHLLLPQQLFLAPTYHHSIVTSPYCTVALLLSRWHIRHLESRQWHRLGSSPGTDHSRYIWSCQYHILLSFLNRPLVLQLRL